MTSLARKLTSSVPPISILALLVGLLGACGPAADTGSQADAGATAQAPQAATEQAAPETAAAVTSAAVLPDSSTTWCGDAPCPCQEGSENKHYGKETLQKCKLSEPTVVQGVHCMAADVSFMPEGSLSRCYLSQDQPVGPYTCAKGKFIEFHRDGHFKSCYLAAAAQIDDIWCKDGTALNDDGSLYRCKVEQASELQGFSIPAGDWITMDQGKIYRWEVSGEPQTFGELSCAGSWNYLHPDGSVAKCKLASPATIDGKQFPADETVCFDTEGKLADCSSMRFRTS